MIGHANRNPSPHAPYRRAHDRHRCAQAAHAGRGRRDRRRHGPVRRARPARPGHQRRAAARLHAQFRPARGGRQLDGAQFGAASRPGLRRRLQPRQGRPQARARQQAAHGGAGQPAVALRRLVPRRAGQVLDPERTHRDDRRRQYRVRRHARGLRRARRGDQGRDRGSRLRAFADLFARPARLHRVPARRARGDEARAPPAGAHASRARGASRCSCRPISAPSSAGRSPRRWPSSAT